MVNIFTASHGRPGFALHETLTYKVSTVPTKFPFFDIHAKSGMRMNPDAVAMISRSIDTNAGSRHVVGILLGDNNFSQDCDPELEVQTIVSCHGQIASKVSSTPK